MAERPPAQRTATERPQAVRLVPPAQGRVEEDEAVLLRQGRLVVREEPDAFSAPIEETIVPAAARSRAGRWGSVFLGALAALGSLALGIAIHDFVTDLLARNPALGWTAAGLAALAALALMALVAREVLAMMRLRGLARLREEAADALARGDGERVARIAPLVVDLYAARPDTAGARAALARERDTILDGVDRLAMVERQLLEPLDRQAQALIAEAARQVSAVTAISPRALVDVAFVLYASARLTRRIAALYGARPGFLGFLRLARAVSEHLLITGGIAASETVLQQVLGQGLVAKLSAKLGEGVLNGLLTARVGLAAIAVCRPLPFVKAQPPRLQQIAGKLLSRVEPAAG